jgi:hypothetical protein
MSLDYYRDDNSKYHVNIYIMRYSNKAERILSSHLPSRLLNSKNKYWSKFAIIQDYLNGSF